jgi:hypothetical protein
MVLALHGLVALVLKAVSLILPHEFNQAEVGVFEELDLVPLLVQLIVLFGEVLVKHIRRGCAVPLLSHLFQIKLHWHLKLCAYGLHVLLVIYAVGTTEGRKEQCVAILSFLGVVLDLGHWRRLELFGCFRLERLCQTLRCQLLLHG